MGPEQLLDLLHDADHRLVRTVDGLSDEDWAGPSLLPGWTRSHVVAHLALSGEALVAVLAGVDRGDAVAMWPSQAVRDALIVELAASSAADKRDRLLGATTAVSGAIAALEPEHRDVVVERTPGGRSFPAGNLPGMRVHELEVHLVDLDAGASYAAWSLPFTTMLLDALATTRSGATTAVVRPDDLGGSWTFGGETVTGPVLTGDAASLAWWLTGRGAGQGVTSETGTLPEIGAW